MLIKRAWQAVQTGGGVMALTALCALAPVPVLFTCARQTLNTGSPLQLTAMTAFALVLIVGIRALASGALAVTSVRACLGESVSLWDCLSSACARAGRWVMLRLACDAISALCALALGLPAFITLSDRDPYRSWLIVPVLVFWLVSGALFPLAATASVTENRWGVRAVRRTLALLNRPQARGILTARGLEACVICLAAMVASFTSMALYTHTDSPFVFALPLIVPLISWPFTHALSSAAYFGIREATEAYQRFAPENTADCAGTDDVP